MQNGASVYNEAFVWNEPAFSTVSMIGFLMSFLLCKNDKLLAMIYETLNEAAQRSREAALAKEEIKVSALKKLAKNYIYII